MRAGLTALLVIAGCATPHTTGVPVAAAAADPCDASRLVPVAHRDTIEKRVAQKRGSMGRSTRNMVATSHVLATETGRSVLARGGNAVDAFIAAVLVQDMVLPGVTSTAGVAGFLVARPGEEPIYVHGPYRAPAKAPAGAHVLLPGAAFALLEAQERYGRLPLAEVLRPVVALAREGFTLDPLFAAALAATPSLRRSPYAQRTYFHDGVPLAAGTKVALPELAATLEAIARNGASELARGAWASHYVDAVRAAGGTVELSELASLHAIFAPALHARYRGRDVYASSSTSFGGRKLLAGLAVLEHADLAKLGGIEHSVEALALFVRTHRAVEAEAWTRDPAYTGERLAQTLASRGEAIWQRVQQRIEPPAAQPSPGTHSSAVIVVDESGVVVVGTHSIEGLNWGDGTFFGGVPLGLSTAGMPTSGRELLDPLSATLVYEDGAPRLALTVYGTGLHPADLQLVSSVLDIGRDVEAAVLAPRLGWFEFDITKLHTDTSRNLLDTRVPPDVVCRLGALGATLQQTSEPGYPAGLLDLGFPTIVEMRGHGGTRVLTGMTPEWMKGLAAGD